MNGENEEPWSEAQIEEWEHDKWLEMQEMEGKIYDPGFNFLKMEEMEDDPFKEEDGRKKKKKQRKPTSRR